jgi:hypothetical protein
MGLRRSLTALLLPFVLAATPAAASDPFITVTPDPAGGNSAFWILPMESRPTGTSVAGLTLAQINAALGPTEARWCAADELTPASFASSDPGIRAEISEYLQGPEAPAFRAPTRINGAPLLAVVGNYRSCAGAAAPFVLLVDQRGPAPRLAYVRPLTDWTPFIAMRVDGNRLIFSSCLECDHAEILSYNRRTRRFVWRSAGL